METCNGYEWKAALPIYHVLPALERSMLQLCWRPSTHQLICAVVTTLWEQARWRGRWRGRWAGEVGDGCASGSPQKGAAFPHLGKSYHRRTLKLGKRRRRTLGAGAMAGTFSGQSFAGDMWRCAAVLPQSLVSWKLERGPSYQNVDG